jgi:hypothetical protein
VCRKRRIAARIGRGQRDFRAKRDRGFPSPARIPKHAARQCNEVGLTGGDDGFGLNGIGDLADGHDGHSGLATDRLGKSNLITRPGGDLLALIQAAGGDVDHFAARPLQAWEKASVPAMSQPPSIQSVADSRTITGFSAGKAARTALKTSNG